VDVDEADAVEAGHGLEIQTPVISAVEILTLAISVPLDQTNVAYVVN
jgi:hypothetical protein